MIELSKCPTCAAEDRVTIAGKEFCMRCGTPAEDNAMIAANNPSLQQSGVVSKFTQNPPPVSNSNQAAEQLPVQVSSPDSALQGVATPQYNAQTDISAPSATSMESVASPSQSPATVQNSAQPDQSLPPLAQPSITPVENMQQPDNPTALLDQKIQTLSMQPSPPAELSQQATAATPAAPVSTAQQVPISNIAPPPPNQSSLPSVLPATTTVSSSAATIDAISAPSTKTSNTMPGADAIMSLDKKEPGVFSDEELHELNNTTVEPLQTTTTTQVQMAATEQSKPSTPVPHDPYAIQNSTASPAFSVVAQPSPSSSMAPYPSDKGSQSTKSTASKILKPAGVVVSIAIIFATGAYLWKLNFPNLAFKIASSKAGINATMPGYVPDGYTLNGSIQTTPGSVSYSLAKSDNKIAVSQSKTDWDSQALAENYVSPKAENYLAVQAQGLTIYMMGNNQASWINKGTWYRIESPNQALTQEQVIKMATSL